MVIDLDGTAEIVTAADAFVLVGFGLAGDADIVVDATGAIEGGEASGLEDLVGEAFFSVTTTATLSVEIEPVEVPFEIAMEDVKIVSVTMPVPSEFDQFGRPTA